MSKDVTVSNVKTTICVEDATSIKNEKATQETENILGAKKIKDELVSPEDYRYAIYGVGYGKVPILLMSFEDCDYQGAVTYAKDACNDDITCYLFDTTRGLRGRSRALVYACAPKWTLNSDEKNVWMEASEGAKYITWHGEEMCVDISRLPSNYPLEDMGKIDFLNISNASFGKVSSQETPLKSQDRLRAEVKSRKEPSVEAVIDGIFAKYGISKELLNTSTSSLDGSKREMSEEVFKKRYAALLCNIIKIMPFDQKSNLRQLENPSRKFYRALRTKKYGKLGVEEEKQLMHCAKTVSNQLWGSSFANIDDVVLRALSFDLAGIDILSYISVVYGNDEAIETMLSTLKDAKPSPDTCTDSDEGR